MSEDSPETPESHKITFPDKPDGGALEEFVIIVKQALEKNAPIQIDLTNVNEMTAAGVQFCIAVQREMTHRGVACQWVSPSNGFMNAFDVLGFYSEMMKMEFV